MYGLMKKVLINHSMHSANFDGYLLQGDQQKNKCEKIRVFKENLNFFQGYSIFIILIVQTGV